MALLEGLRAEFADHDAFLHLLLGLIASSRRLEQSLPAAAPVAPAEPSPVLEAEEERRVLALLGLISMRKTLMGPLEVLRAQQEQGPMRQDSSETPARVSGSLGLLR